MSKGTEVERKRQLLRVQEGILNEQDRITFSRRTKKLAKALIESEFWCLGRDIVRSQGNLLLEFGFKRERPPAGRYGSSKYTLDLSADSSLTVWGFGMTLKLRSSGALFIRRFDFSPLLREDDLDFDGVFHPAHLPKFIEPKGKRACLECIALLEKLSEAFLRYETWIENNYGLAYRQTVLKQGKRKHKKFQKLGLVNGWNEFSAELKLNSELDRVRI